MKPKTMSITKEAYSALSRKKMKGESFSNVTPRLVKSRGRISDCVGVWDDMSKEEYNKMLSSINEMRAKATSRLVKNDRT